MKVGDRVKVEFEGTVTATMVGWATVHPVGWSEATRIDVPRSVVEVVVPKRIWTKGDVVVGLISDHVYVRGYETWTSTDVPPGVSWPDVQIDDMLAKGNAEIVRQQYPDGLPQRRVVH